MKRLFSGIIAMLLLVICMFTFTGCKEKEVDNNLVKVNYNVSNPVASTKVLKLGFDDTFYPYGYKDAETLLYKGFDLEFAKMVCDELGWKLELVPINWDLKDAEINSGNIDCIWNGFTINTRENDYEWTDAYCDNTIVVLVKESSGINSLADLSGKIVMAQAGSSAEDALNDKDNTALVSSFKNGNFLTVANYVLGYQELKQGSVDALVVDSTVVESFVGNDTGYKVLTEVISTEQYGVGFKKGNTMLCSIINTVMKEVAKTNEFKDLVKKYGLEDTVIFGK